MERHVLGLERLDQLQQSRKRLFAVHILKGAFMLLAVVEQARRDEMQLCRIVVL